MRRFIALLSAAAIVATLLPASAFAADNKRPRQARGGEPVYAAAAVPPNPLLFVLGGAAIGAVIGAVVCPPCSIAGSALTSGGGALVGGGIGAVSGAVVAVAVEPRFAAIY